MVRKNNNSVLNIPSSFYLLGASFMLVMAFTIIGSNIDAMSSKVIFIGSIVTTSSAVVTPLFSIKILKLDSYKIKIYSITTGIILGLISTYLLYIDNGMINELFDYSTKGLLWLINISLLLFSLATLEIENNEAKIKEATEELKKTSEELIATKKIIIEKNKELEKYQKKEIEEKKGNKL